MALIDESLKPVGETALVGDKNKYEIHTMKSNVRGSLLIVKRCFLESIISQYIEKNPTCIKTCYC
jgi:hypothetical protein